MDSLSDESGNGALVSMVSEDLNCIERLVEALSLPSDKFNA